jgi:hypothetical protein
MNSHRLRRLRQILGKALRDPAFRALEGTEGAETGNAGSNETQQTESEHLSYGVRSHTYPLNPPPKREESFANSLAEEVLPNPDFKKAVDVAHVYRMTVGHSKQNDSLASQDGVPGRDGEYWYPRYEEREDNSLMVILVAGHEELVAHPSKSGPMSFVYFRREHPEFIECAARGARVDVVRYEVLKAYREHSRSQNEVSSPSGT